MRHQKIVGRFPLSLPGLGMLSYSPASARFCKTCKRTKHPSEFKDKNVTCISCRGKSAKRERRCKQRKKKKRELRTMFASLNAAFNFDKVFQALSQKRIASVEQLRKVSQMCIHTHLYMHAHTHIHIHMHT